MYIYNATGQKVKKVVEENGQAVVNTDYLSGFQYKNATLQFFPHAEGYVHYTKPLTAQGGANSALGSFNYVFNYTDHLGNIRLSYSDANNNNTISENEILEENHYYPFGLKHSAYNTQHQGYIRQDELNNLILQQMPKFAGDGSYNYKYNGKELQDELGLNMYDYGARNYDPAIGRWMNIDPLAEVSRRWSPYTYCYNNPLIFTDPDGMLATPPTELFNTDGKKIGQDANGNDGNVSIIADKDKVKEIQKNYKDGGTATEADVASGVQTTKAVLSEALSVLNVAKKIINGDEAKSVVEPNGNVTKGTEETKLNDGQQGVTRTYLPSVAGNDNTSIHSHDVQVKKQPDGTYSYNDARIPGPDDPGTFAKYATNVIVGNLGAPTITPIPGKSEPKVSLPSQGGVFYDRAGKPVLELKASAITKILK